MRMMTAAPARDVAAAICRSRRACAIGIFRDDLLQP
jgi:hypothetical protein